MPVSGAEFQMLASSCTHSLNSLVELVQVVSDEVYVQEFKMMQGSTIGKHIRHSLEHFAKLFESFDGENVNPLHVIHYDQRVRGVPVETDRKVAVGMIETLLGMLGDLTPEHLDKPVQISCIVNQEGNEIAFPSTFGRELWFAVHHFIHHCAFIKAFLASSYPGIQTPENFGVAPSTVHFSHQHKKPHQA
eukprot:TRINITY_DN19952_c0_g1::TRINITY_DN19952_c0_g1_i1::g.1352::m.1352 TRINITY_DN19952_c0_g1::TRINITY_DN19952_c0_g1_i1::g.1352  ORF type:complete len:205 (+),score=14.16,sp/P0C1J7/FKBP5_RHIO9/35.85/1e-12,DinB_2/PF12867.2/0.0062 TRINITY_DN19952_c0_g1_i1:48-617(+)